MINLISTLFAQSPLDPVNTWDEVFKLLTYVFTNASGLGTVGIIVCVAQVVLFVLQKTTFGVDLSGKWKLGVIAFSTLVISVLSIKISNPDFGFWSIALSSVCFSALQTFAFNIYKEFFKK